MFSGKTMPSTVPPPAAAPTASLRTILPLPPLERQQQQQQQQHHQQQQLTVASHRVRGRVIRDPLQSTGDLLRTKKVLSAATADHAVDVLGKKKISTKISTFFGEIAAVTAMLSRVVVDEELLWAEGGWAVDAGEGRGHARSLDVVAVAPFSQSPTGGFP